MTNQKWQPTKYQRERLISFTKKYITQKLNDLHKELDCSNDFIFDFIKDIQQDWDPDSNKVKASKLQNSNFKKKFK